ncbi:hypothetical protein [Halobacterium litoreum]|uniref:Domain of unknown function domain-containing protein n=1 Tax=Halobacterium litoreum TaxID=2039234 RepID=A0ABD5NEC3_9EURY|nr:hypothetical protein [Halobacterium litoreum]UHH13526.1 hypothetical protein LT972_00685 [Halobacterium litoreum]
MSDSDKRDRGVLTEADRAFLRGDRELGSVQSERNARARIRDRVYDALLDFEVLVEHLEDRDAELVFGKRASESDGTEAFDAFVSHLAFLYSGLEHTDLDFETVLREGVNLAEAANDRAAAVDYDVTFHALDADHLREKVEDGESLSLTEIAFLYESDDVSRDELADLLGESRASDVDDGRVQSKVTEF